MNDLSGYKIRELSWIQDRHPDHSYSCLASGDLIALAPYDNGEWGIRIDNGVGGRYGCKTKEEAITLCNAWQREAVMRLLEKA